MEISVKDLLKSGAHFGHRKSRWHPKMKEYIFGLKSGVHIIDLEKTIQAFDAVKPVINQVVENDGSILFLATKKQAQAITEKYAKECGMPYINHRYIGGFITNFQEIRKLIRKYKSLLSKREKGELKKYTKKEQLEFDREIERLDEAVSGVASLDALPDLIFLIDVKNEKTAINEARKKHIPMIGICDTNVNPQLVDYVIPGNDDATKAIELYCAYMASLINKAKALKPKETKEPEVKASVKEKKVAKTKKKAA